MPRRASQVSKRQARRAPPSLQRHPGPVRCTRSACSHARTRGQGQGRKKKKFFQKGSNGAPQGNMPPTRPATRSAARKANAMTRTAGPREFVGPMDHSYRVVNGNVADGPPSTIQITSNGHNGDYYQDPYAARSAPPFAKTRLRASSASSMISFSRPRSTRPQRNSASRSSL